MQQGEMGEGSGWGSMETEEEGMVSRDTEGRICRGLAMDWVGNVWRKA